MQALFGSYNNKNGYRYYFNKNEALIKQVEELWMKAHQHI